MFVFNMAASFRDLAMAVSINCCIMFRVAQIARYCAVTVRAINVVILIVRVSTVAGRFFGMGGQMLRSR